jgi:Uma2 family endonuclease
VLTPARFPLVARLGIMVRFKRGRNPTMLVHDLPTDLQTDMDIIHLHDDTEEDLVGSDVHQDAIVTSNQGLRRVARRGRLPWHVSNQLMVLMGRLSGKEWRPSPDVFVHASAGPEPLNSFDVALHGVPEVVIEVASGSTWDYDVTIKRRSYGHVGVREYLVFDPTAEFLGTSVRAWHATPRGFLPWRAGPDGRWHSSVLGVSFMPEGLLLRVYDRDGALVPTFDEQEWLAAEQTWRLAEQERRIAEQARQSAEQARRIAELEATIRALRPPEP